MPVIILYMQVKADLRHATTRSVHLVAPLARLQPTEALGLLFFAPIGMMFAWHRPALTQPNAAPALAVSAAIWLSYLVAILGIGARAARHRPHRLRRDLVAVVMCLCVYPSLGWMIPMLNARNYDATLAAADRALFGGRQPIVDLETLLNPVAVDVFTAAYVLAWVPAALMIIKHRLHGRDRAHADLLLALLLAHYLGFIGYALVPAAGPWRAMAGPFSTTIDNAYLDSLRAMSIGVDAFPSLHTATTVLILLFAWRDDRHAFWLLTPLALMIIMSTLYLRWHYAVDVIAGLALAAGCRWLAPRVVTGWPGVRHRAQLLK